jgi:sugar/nucleoside kinase (ribokinase family)
MRNAVAAIGLCSWDRFLVLDRYPALGDYAIVQRQFEQAGGTTSNTCAALARLGLPVALVSKVGSDREGDEILASLDSIGCDTSMVSRDALLPTDSSVILVPQSESSRDRTILWLKGAQPVHRMQLPLDRIMDHRWVLVDVNDDQLREFLLSLPAHLSPRTQLIGAMTYLTDTSPEIALRHLLQHDVMFGNRRELLYVTGSDDLSSAVVAIQAAMEGHACRVIYLTLGAEGAIAIRPKSVTSMPAYPVNVVDTTGAGDAFAAGCIWGLLDACADEEILARGNAVGGLSCQAMGARAGLPSRHETIELQKHGVRGADAPD